MTKEKLKTFAAVVAALVWLCLLIAGLRGLFGNSVLWLLLTGFLALVVMGITAGFKRRRAFRVKGYEIFVEGDHRFIYRERTGDGIREFSLPGDLMEMGHPVYYRLSGKDWDTLAPDWARNRQLEIEARIHENPFYRPDGW